MGEAPGDGEVGARPSPVAGPQCGPGGDQPDAPLGEHVLPVTGQGDRGLRLGQRLPGVLTDLGHDLVAQQEESRVPGAVREPVEDLPEP
ncbi:hypothetical protein HFP72_08040 [Nocardiopsis sp. ARC36]